MKNESNFAGRIEQFAKVLNDAVITHDISLNALLNDQGIEQMIQLLNTCRTQEGTVYLIGNGGSAAIASHAVIDFLNMVKVRAMAMLDPAVTTCLSNDYGYETVYQKQLEQFAKKGDVLIAISSSGKSKNILNAVSAAKAKGVKTITLSGFSEDNPLRISGDFNLWLSSNDYGQVEIGHAFFLHHLTDRLKQY